MEKAVAAVLVASALICFFLTGFTVARKLRRDKNEALFRARRARFGNLLRSGPPEQLEAELRLATGVRSAQVDLMIALDAVWPELDGTRREEILRSVTGARFDDALTRQLRSHDAVLRATAALLVGRLRLQEASRIIAPLAGDCDGDVRLAAVRALADLADASSAHVLIAALSERLLEPERLIERLGNKWAVPTILKTMERGDDGPICVTGLESKALAPQPVRASLGRALGLAGDPTAEPALRQMLRTGGFEERVSAARALGTAGSVAAVPDLEAALADTEWPLRAQAARSLGLVGAGTEVPALVACLSDSAWWVRAAAAKALGHLGDPGWAALRDALVHSDPYARQRAREELALHGLVTDGA
jgi:HEAT repeat protein